MQIQLRFKALTGARIVLAQRQGVGGWSVSIPGTISLVISRKSRIDGDFGLRLKRKGFGMLDGIVAHTRRLQPGQDLKIELARMAREKKLQASTVICAVGSLSQLCLRLATANQLKTWSGPHEIVSLTGTLSESGMHLHLSASDSEGRTVGGHLVEGNTILTTCELVVLEQTKVQYHRALDPQTGYLELVVRAVSDLQV